MKKINWILLFALTANLRAADFGRSQIGNKAQAALDQRRHAQSGRAVEQNVA